MKYKKWGMWKDGMKKGEELNVGVYKLVEGGVVEKLGKEWYDEVWEVGEEVVGELEE